MLNTCRIFDHKEVADGIFLLMLEGRSIVSRCRPGQFVHIRVNDSMALLWRRPFSIHRIERDAGTFQIVYRVLGPGTKNLSRKKSGEALDCMGPLGNGFSLDNTFSHGLIVAGGLGSAGLFYLADTLLKMGKTVTFLWGVRKKSELFGTGELKKRNVDLRIASDDGSIGFRGLVTGLLKKTLDESQFDKKNVKGFVCGPKGMIREVQLIAQKTDMEWQVSLEEKMACGMNVCKGCAVKIKSGGYGMVCSDGPSFDLREVILED